MSSQKKNKITIKQIAEIAGVSFSTVAKALNDDKLINADTRKKIVKIAKQLGYYPNLLATGLRKKSTKTVGVILNDLTKISHHNLWWEKTRPNMPNYTLRSSLSLSTLYCRLRSETKF